MIKDNKRNIAFFILIISLIIFLILCLGIYYLISNYKEAEQIEKIPTVTLTYIIDNTYNASIDVELKEEEQKELFNLVDNLKYEPNETKCMVDSKYFITYDNNELYLDESCGLAIYNGKTYSVAKSKNELSKFLKKKIDSLNNVYFFNYNHNSQSAKMINLTTEEKNRIRTLWNQHSKMGIQLSLGIVYNYFLYIDGEFLGIQDLNSYIETPYGFLTFNNDLYNELASHIGMDTKHFNLFDYENYFLEEPKYINKEITSREDVVEVALSEWNFDEIKEQSYEIEMYYDNNEDCYLIYAWEKSIDKDTYIVGGEKNLIIRKNGEIIAIWDGE